MGTYEGLSLSYIFPICKRNGNTIYAIDMEYHPLLEAHLMLWNNDNDTAIMITRTSEQAAEIFDSESLDMVFIDANHDFEFIYQDIKTWSHKLKIGGILCGHDYNKPHFGVIEAVNALIGKGNIQVAGTFWWITHTKELANKIRSAA